jgi:UDP-glucose:(heptosyl)LPS alpha-1,3-glucosyltransferase
MTSPLALAIVRQRYAQDGGAERFVARALEALRSQDVKLTLVTREWAQGANVDVLKCNPFYLGRVWRDWSFARCVCRALEGRRFDIVQSHERIACCDLYRAGDGVHREWLAQLRRVRGPLGCLGLALNPYHAYTKATETALFTSARLKAVICNSKMVREEIRQHFGTAEEKLHVIYSGVDTDIYHPRLKTHRANVRASHGIPQGAPLFLFVGSGFERKGVSTALEALAALPPSAYLLIVGRDRKMAAYKALALSLGVGGRAIFVGAQADVKPYYGAADALVLPTLYDPFPNVVLEAMAAGLCVITSTKCGAAEILEEGVDGHVCDALDLNGFAETMDRLADGALFEAMGAAARRKVERFTLKRMSEELSALYARLIAPSM